jgi:hypothetical protein
MGKIKPVTADAIIDPSVAALGAKKGALTVLLSKADGTGTPGITVTVNGQSAVTDQNGCAVIGNLDIGPQKLTYSDAAYVDKNSISPVSQDVNISAGTIAQATGFYDHPGRIDLSVAKDQNATWPPAWNPMKYTVDHDQRITTPTNPTTAFTVDGGSGVTTQYLWPFPSAYRAFVGTCAGNNPANSLYGGGNQGFQLNSGDQKTLALTMPTSTITVDTSQVVSNRRGSATELLIAPETGFTSMSGCSAGAMQFWSNGSGNDSTYTVQVPYGVWRACVNYKYSDGKWRQGKTGTATGTDSAVPASPIVATPSQATGSYKTDLKTTVQGPAYATGGSSNPSNSC